jgi:hypothetical protein
MSPERALAGRTPAADDVDRLAPARGVSNVESYSARSPQGRPPRERERAAAWLRKHLTEPTSIRCVFDAAAEQGISERTLRRAARDGGVRFLGGRRRGEWAPADWRPDPEEARRLRAVLRALEDRRRCAM